MPSDYNFFQNRLGSNAKLGVSFSLLNNNGEQIKKDGFNEKLPMPMASTMKIAIALLALRKIFLENSLNLNAVITINNGDFCPGPPWNTLDRYFFTPWQVSTTKTVDELLTIMLTESDNTATDTLLNLIGGPAAVNSLMNELGLRGYNLHSTTKQLLSDYYEFHADKTLFNIFHVLWEFLSAYKMKATEKSIFTNEKNTCTPECKLNLITLLVTESQKNELTWLCQSAKWLCLKMALCTTGLDLIRRGASHYSSQIHRFGDKTGSIGGILNDAAFIQFNDGQWMILSIYSCFSTQGKQIRQKIISDLTQDIPLRNLDYQLPQVECEKKGLLYKF